MVLARSSIRGDSGKETLITGGGDGTIKMWPLIGNGEPGAIECYETLQNGDNSILSMALDGTFLYSGRLEGDIDIWDLDTHQLIRTINAHTADVLTITVGHDMIFTGDSNGGAKVTYCAMLEIFKLNFERYSIVDTVARTNGKLMIASFLPPLSHRTRAWPCL